MERNVKLVSEATDAALADDDCDSLLRATVQSGKTFLHTEPKNTTKSGKEMSAILRRKKNSTKTRKRIKLIKNMINNSGFEGGEGGGDGARTAATSPWAVPAPLYRNWWRVADPGLPTSQALNTHVSAKPIFETLRYYFFAVKKCLVIDKCLCLSYGHCARLPAVAPEIWKIHHCRKQFFFLKFQRTFETLRSFPKNFKKIQGPF